MTKTCKECSETFTPIFSEKERCKNAKFCSLPCYWAFSKKNPNKGTFKKGHKTVIGYVRRGKENNMWKGGQLEKTCLTCNSVFFIDRYRMNAKTCSKSCDVAYRGTDEARIALSTVQRSLVPQVLTDNRSIRNLLRTCSRYAMWREKVLKKDDYTCQNCGKRGGRLQADHIKPFVQIILENKVETYEQALECAELWDVKNGQTLCVLCHYKSPTFGSKVLKLLAK